MGTSRETTGGTIHRAPLHLSPERAEDHTVVAGSNQARATPTRGSPFMTLHPPTRRSSSVGCLSILIVGIITCGMVVVNSVLVAVILPAITKGLPVSWYRPKLAQSLLFILPVILTLIEWWIIDWITDLRRAARYREES